MADGNVILPPELRAALQLPEGIGRQNGVPLPEPTNPYDNPDDEISIDFPGGHLGIAPDGAISSPSIRESKDDTGDFDDNLAFVCGEGVLNSISEEVHSGVEADLMSRTDWYEQYQKGLELLGTKIEDVGRGGSQRRNISRANDTTMMEAIVKYWAGAAAELMPAAGPAKVMTIGKSSTDEDARAKAFEDDFNYYLTEKAPEYYPDTNRMLIHQAFCGMGYKKTYRCPIRRRPVSESVLATDLIVSEEATDLDNALRVTHQIEMALPTLRRMMAAGQYRDIDLGTPSPGFGVADGVRRAVAHADGLMVGFGIRPQDQPYEIWETDVFLEPDGIPGRYEDRAPLGMPLPYKVTLDRTSRKILGLWRNWRPDDDLYLKRNMYVRFGLIPSLGYSDWGFLQLLGNQTRALRAILRLLIDAGMFSIFPGGFKATNARSATNELAPGPGEFINFDLPVGADINKMFMTMPYKEPSAVFIQLMEIIKQDAMRLGGTVQLEVGEGRANVPVGTVLAMVEQQVQVMAEVHKGNHRAQKQELRNLRELFAEDPKSLWLLVRDRPRDREAAVYDWSQKEAEFTDLNLVPASDPNVPSFIHRLLVANVLMLIAQQAPADVDLQAVLRNAIATLGANPDQYVIRPDQKPQGPAPEDPRVTAKIIDSQSKERQSIVQAHSAAEKLDFEREKLALDASKAAAMNETSREVEREKQAGGIAQLHHSAALNPPRPSGIG